MQAQQQIKVDLRERIYSYVERIEHSFALDNYKYIMNNIQDELIQDVYRKLGPFDHFENMNPDESDLDSQRGLRLNFD